MKDKGELPPVLDVCCSRRSFWFDKNDNRALFLDNRKIDVPLVSNDGYSRRVVICPDVQADFTELPFQDNCFYLVVFDPPHIKRTGDNSNFAKAFGVLKDGWQEMLGRGFSECFRVLRPLGTLVFKWSEADIPLKSVLSLTPEKPLFGHRSGKASRTHWVAFIKGADSEG